MSTYGTRLGIIKQILGLGYKDLVERLDKITTDRSLRNYIDNKTQMPGNIITMVTEVFPEIDSTWWHTGEGQILKGAKAGYQHKNLESMVSEPEALYNAAKKGENVTIPASELFKALFKDMTEVNKLLQSRLEYYEVFIKNIDKYKI
jgi:hypothetical protein